MRRTFVLLLIPFLISCGQSDSAPKVGDEPKFESKFEPIFKVKNTFTHLGDGGKYSGIGSEE